LIPEVASLSIPSGNLTVCYRIWPDIVESLNDDVS
jgi:hypothetical protein